METGNPWNHAKALAALRAFVENAIAEAPEAERGRFEIAIKGLAMELCGTASTAPTPYGDAKKIPPLPAWVSAYSASIGYALSGEKWCDVYAVKGWKVGTARMKDWKAAVRNWKANSYGAGTITIGTTSTVSRRGEPASGDEFKL